MTANILHGGPIAESIKRELADEVARLYEEQGFRPGLAVIRVGEDPASAVYVGNKVRSCNEIGIISEHLHPRADSTTEELLEMVRKLNIRDDIDGILVQLPLPDGIDETDVLEAIDPAKDVDGFHPINVGRLHQGRAGLMPCTPAGVIEILKRSGITITGKHAVVVGRSNIVGKPMAALLMRENATVTICHSRTANLTAITQQADILIAAIGRPGFIRAEHIGEGSVVIDVGINSVSDKAFAKEIFPDEETDRRISTIDARGATLAGDVNFREAVEKAGSITPVPGGVGLLTVAMLMKNTVEAAKARREI